VIGFSILDRRFEVNETRKTHLAVLREQLKDAEKRLLNAQSAVVVAEREAKRVDQERSELAGMIALLEEGSS
jgi:hypothetical protein